MDRPRFFYKFVDLLGKRFLFELLELLLSSAGMLLMAIRILLPFLLLAGCQQRTPRPAPDVPKSIEQLRHHYTRSRGRPRLAMELAEAIKCRQVRVRLLETGARPHRLPELNRAVLPSLQPNEAILSLYEDGTLLRRFLARGSRVSSLKPLALSRLNPLLIKARDELEYGDLDSPRMLNTLLTRLFQLLLSDVLDGSQDDLQRLLVLPHGLTRFIPFHALVNESRYVARLVQVTYAPCLALAGDRLTHKRAVILAPTYDPESLSGAKKEIQHISSRLPGAVVLKDRQATRNRLLQAIGKSGTLVHFAGHGLADLTAQEPPELVFPGEQESVVMQDLTRRPVRSSPIVLACCTTAYVARFRDDRRLMTRTNLVEALLAAGATSVVAASWAVKDRQSMFQMRDFYDRLPSDGPAGALTHAHRRSIARLRPPHPRFWAFYAAYGAWR